MADSDFQDDFFDGESPRDKARKLGAMNGYIKHRVLSRISVSAEYAVITAIGILVLIIVAYSAGVENGLKKGKRLADAEFAELPAAVSPLDESLAALKMPDVVETYEFKEVKPEVTEVKKEEKPAEKTTEKKSGGSYVIQLASYGDEKSAKSEIKKLEAKGTSASFSKVGKWYQVFAKGYKTKAQAESARKKLSSRYKDCFVKKVKQ